MGQFGFVRLGTEQIGSEVGDARRRRLVCVGSALAMAMTGALQFGVGTAIPVAFAADLVVEDFDTDGEGTRYTSNNFNDTNSDFFERTASNPHPNHDAPGFSSLTFTTPQVDSYWASEDVSGAAGNSLSTHGIVRLNDLNVATQTNLQVSVFLGATAIDRFDVNDRLEVQYAFDGNSGGATLTSGSYTTIGRFVGDGNAFSSLAMKQDTDLDGSVTDPEDLASPELTTTMTEYTFSIPGSGTNLSVQVRIEQNGGTEELAFDHITISGDAATSTPPVLSNIEGGAITYTESDPATQVTNTITVSDPDSTDLESATVQITSNVDSGEDVLAASPPGGIAAVYVAETGTLTLTGTASVADYQTALRSVIYDNTDDNDPSPATRTVTFSVSDSSGGSNTQARDISVVPTIGAGTIPHTESFETNGEGESYESNEFNSGVGIFDRATGQPSQFADPISGVDSSFYWAAEQTSNPANPLGGDVGYLKLLNLDSTGWTGLQVEVALAAGNDNNLRWENNDKIEVQYAFDGNIGSSIDTGTYVTIGRFIGNGDSTVGGDLVADADLNGIADSGGTELTTAMQDFAYSIPATGAVLSIRVVVENDGSEEVAFDNIRVTGVDDPNIAPTLANIEGAALLYTEEDPATQITNTITVADTDDTDLESATIQITSNLDPTEDVLAVTSPPAGITVSAYVPGTGLLTLTGTASLADYQTALRAVTYVNTDLNDPSETTRTVTFQVFDGTSFSNMATRDINVIPVIGTGVVPHVESFELVDSTHGEGESYESNEFDTGVSSGIFNRVTAQPVQFADVITGVDDSAYWAVEGTSNAANPLGGNVGYLKLQDLDASGYIDLEVVIALASSRVGQLRWETDDTIEIQYAFDGDIGSSIDTGTYTTIGRFIGASGELVQDTNLDGTGDGGGLTAALTDFTFSIPDTGTLLSIRVVVENDGSEEVAFDNLRVNGTGSIVEFSQAAYSVGEDGTPVVTAVTLTRSGNLAVDASVQVDLTDGTATGASGGGAGSDYDNDPLVVNFTGSSASETVVVPITQDVIVEADETINLGLTALNPATQIGTQSTATLTIEDDDTATVGIAGTTNGNEEGPVDGVFTVTQTAESSTDTVLAYSVGGSATAGSDFTAPIGSVTIPAGATSATITVPVIDDPGAEPTETVDITLTSITDGDADITIDGGNDTASIDIFDNDLAVSIAATTDGDEDGPVNGVFTVTQTDTSLTDTVVSYAVTGTATSGSDFTALSGSATIMIGATSSTIVVPVIDDAIVEGTETVVVTLTAVTGGDAAIDPAGDDASIDILDNDSATVSIAGTTDGDEAGPINGVFTVSQTAESSTDTTVSYTVTGTASSGTDFTALSGTATIMIGATSTTISVPVIDDAIVEATETVVVTLNTITSGDPDVTIDGANDSDSIDILDNDSATVSIAGTTDGDEAGPINGVFTVSQTAESSTDTTVSYTVTGTASSGTDFTALSGTATIMIGATSTTISVPVIDDAIVEATETVVVTLNTITSGDPDITIDGANDSDSIDIFDNDAATVSIGDVSLSEGDSGTTAFMFTITSTNEASEDITVLVDTATVTATGGGVDYADVVNQTATIPAGSTSATVTVDVTGELLVELDETFEANITDARFGGVSDATRVTIGDSQGIGTIINDDAATLSIGDVSASETDGATTFSFSATLSSPVDTAVSVSVNTADGTAIESGVAPNNDYLAISGGTLTILAGGTTGTIDVTVNGDNFQEPDETFFVNLSGLAASGRDVTFADDQGQGTIENDDSPPIPDADGPYTIDEGDPLTLDASGSFDPDGDPMTFTWDVNDDGVFGDATGVNPTLTWAQLVALGIDDGPYFDNVTVEVSDGTNAATDTSTLSVDNVAPVVTVSPLTQMVQYSDPIADVTIGATDVAADEMTASTEWSTDGGTTFTPGLPDDGTVAGGLTFGLPGAQSSPASWTLSGVADLSPGTYLIRVSVEDDDGGVGTVDIEIVVGPEDADVEFDAGNPVAVEVETDGGDSGIFTIVVTLSEPADGSPGNIDTATLDVTLEPVGPGNPITGSCVQGASGTGEWTCTFDDVPVNTYEIVALVGGNYSGEGSDVVVVFDPSLGFTTGGGWYLDPDSDDKVTFGYTMKYNKKRTNVQGSLLVIRHTDEGIYRLKSNQISGLAIGSGADFDWASFTGKATYKEPTWDDAVGNYQFVAYVEDHGTPGAGADRFWVTAQRKGVEAGGLSLDAPATTNAVTLGGGNIVVPHQGGGGDGGGGRKK